MKIVENTADQLIFEQTPWVLGTIMTLVSVGVIGTILVLLYYRQWLAGAFIFGVSILVVPTAFLLLVQRTQIIVNTTEVSIRAQNLARTWDTNIPLQTVTRADVEGFRQVGDVITTYRPVLVTDTGEVPLRKGFQSGNGAQDIADTINTWLTAHRGG